jgi:hypothetical protein
MMLLRSVILRHNLSLWVTLAITVAYTACLYSAQTPTQPPTPASRPPGYAEVPAVHASDAQQLVEPFNPALHSIFIIGDSTAAYHIDRMKEGYAEAQGWGVFFYAFFDPSKVNVVKPFARRQVHSHLPHRRPVGQSHRPVQARRCRPAPTRPERYLCPQRPGCSRHHPRHWRRDAGDRQHRHPQARDRAHLRLVPAQVHPRY